MKLIIFKYGHHIATLFEKRKQKKEIQEDKMFRFIECFAVHQKEIEKTVLEIKEKLIEKSGTVEENIFIGTDPGKPEGDNSTTSIKIGNIIKEELEEVFDNMIQPDRPWPRSSAKEKSFRPENPPAQPKEPDKIIIEITPKNSISKKKTKKEVVKKTRKTRIR